MPKRSLVNYDLGNGAHVINSTDPASAQDVATKQYVDANVNTLAHGFGLAAGQGLSAWDNFARPDGLIQNTISPTGQRYIKGFTSQNASISGHHFIRNTVPPNNWGGDGSQGVDGSAAIFLPIETLPTDIACSYVFSAGSTTDNDCVLACGAVGLVPAIQFACSQVHWQVFCPFGSPIAYHVFGSGNFAVPLQTGVEYTSRIHVDLSTSTITLYLPDGTIQVITDPMVAQYWGKVVILQSRRPLNTDGDSYFTQWASAPFTPPKPAMPPIQPGTISALNFPGDGTSYVASSKVTTWNPSGNLIIDAEIAPKQVAPGGAFRIILSEYSTGIRAFYFGINASGILSLVTSPDGTALVTDSASVALPVPDNTFVKVRAVRTGNDGSGNRVTTFWTSVDNGATYQQLGATRTVAAPTTIYAAYDSFVAGGTLSITNTFPGQIRSVAVTDPSTLISGPITITASTATFTTPNPHGLAVLAPFVPGTVTGTTGINAGTTYYVASIPSPTTFTLSTTADGQTPLILTGNGSLASGVGSVVIGSLDNTYPWSVYAGLSGSYTDPQGNSWFATGATEASLGWRWTALSTAATLPPLPNNPAGTTVALRLPGDGSYVYTPAPARTVSSGVLDLQANITPDSWSGNNGVDQCIMAQWAISGGQRAVTFNLAHTAKPYCLVSGDGLTFVSLSGGTAVPAPDGTALTIRALITFNDGAGHMTCQFYTSPDNGTTWNTLGALVSVALPATPGILASTANYQVGGRDTSAAGGALPFKGQVTSFQAFDGANGTLIARLSNTSPWFGYQGTAGVYTDAATTPNTWRMAGSTPSWIFIIPSTTPVRQQMLTVTSNGTFTVPPGVTTLRIIAVGGGGGGGGGGSSAITGGVATQTGGGGGAGGCPIEQVFAVTPGTVLTHGIGGGGNGGVGGAVGSGGTGNPGIAASSGIASNVSGTGVSVVATGGGFGNFGGANSIASVGGGLSGLASLYTSTTNFGMAGSGEYTTTAIRRAAPPWPQGPSGGQSGQYAITTNGGTGGVAGAWGAQPPLTSGAGGSAPDANGTAGGNAAANSGCGGGGGGGGAAGGAGGNGGNGGSGYVTYIWVG